MNSQQPDQFRESEDELRIPIVEEVAHVDVRERLTGRVRVRTETVVENATVEHDLERSTVEVERVAVGRMLDDGEPFPAVRTEGDVTIMPVVEEVLVVERRFRLVEEVRVTQRTSTQTTAVPVQLRRQRAVVERAGPDGVFHTATPDNED